MNNAAETPTSTGMSVSLYNTDCFAAFKRIPANSIDAVITDPPYFLHKLGNKWDIPNITKSTKKQTVQSLPGGMKFDSQQGRDFQEFMHRVAVESMRVLKPGGAFLSFSAPRLYHRLAVGVEDAGFEIRDLLLWIYTQNQVKAMSVERFIKTTKMPANEERLLREQLAVWKTPQIKSCVEPIVFAQKPKVDDNGRAITFLENWQRWGVGMINTSARVGAAGDMFPANVMTTQEWADPETSDAYNRAFLVGKPGKRERGGTKHISVKPLTLMDHLVRLFVQPGGHVLDPFNGSGSTGISAVRCGVNYTGFELGTEYWHQSMARFTDAFGENIRWTVSSDFAEATVHLVEEGGEE